MGEAKAKGAGAGAATGALAGSSFGPVGAAIGGIGGATLGYFGAQETPQYEQPPLDPAFMALKAQNRQQNIDAINARVRGDQASAEARYGTLTSGDNASILARYGAMLAAAQAG